MLKMDEYWLDRILAITLALEVSSFTLFPIKVLKVLDFFALAPTVLSLSGCPCMFVLDFCCFIF